MVFPDEYTDFSDLFMDDGYDIKEAIEEIKVQNLLAQDTLLELKDEHQQILNKITNSSCESESNESNGKILRGIY